jgi:hypothetical protein
MNAASRSPRQGGEAAAHIDVQEHIDDTLPLRAYQARWPQQRLGTWRPMGRLLADFVFAVAPR